MGSPNTKILNISVEEQPTGELSLGAGYGTDGVFGGGLTEKFLGKGVTLKSDFQISSDGVKFSNMLNLILTILTIHYLRQLNLQLKTNFQVLVIK